MPHKILNSEENAKEKNTKNLPKIKKLCNQQQPKAKNIQHINFYNNATNYVLPQKKTGHSCH